MRTVLNLHKDYNIVQSSHIPPTQFPLWLISSIIMVHLLELRNQY